MISYGRILRTFHKIDSGYLIKDYENSRLTQIGFSKLVFPLIKSGTWKTYSHYSGKKETEHYYLNNQAISTKFWVNEFTSYGDSLKPGETPPIFKGGNYAMLKFLAENTNYPEEAKENNIQGKVIIRVLISSQGEMVNPIVVNIVDINLARESIRVIKLLKGKWIPGTTGSVNSDAFITIPINFTLK